MRLSGSTAAASVKINPAPPVAILPRWTKCQSLAIPSCAEYWHIGETTTRFLRVMPRRVIGENRIGCDAIEILLTGLLRIKCVAACARDTGGSDARGRPFPPVRH